jgi:hypothetical protein
MYIYFSTDREVKEKKKKEEKLRNV